MTTDDERTDEAPVSLPPVGELPGQLPFDRLDYGDAEQLAEMAGGDDPATEEPLQLVDEPLRIPPPYDRTHKRRNQRRLPT
ncbi:hypothetical protein Q2K19_13500 [Micromonospora soli]|uniref:hypothetical protein n=1 Tax=Micromonospora sp. NBRC 110009 TaxID=3061627 RepID=UPI00267143D0|nr:hypothetical protein [Micromonospora sp. NBRC 110009]WKU01407.1 hypothetical protein Q2K19_13500 [Micromonospora sp. NBRC 110009]